MGHKKIWLIPTTHVEIPSYTSQDLAELIMALEPDIIFEELPANLYENIWKSSDGFGQEDRAIRKVISNRNIPHIPVDLPFRNEVARDLGLYVFEEEVGEILRNNSVDTEDVKSMIKNYHTQWDRINESINQYGLKYILSADCEKSIHEKDSTLEKIIETISAIRFSSLRRLFELSRFFHCEMRERSIAELCVSGMKDKNIGALLIGFEHFSILDRLRSSAGSGVEIERICI